MKPWQIYLIIALVLVAPHISTHWAIGEAVCLLMLGITNYFFEDAD